MHFLNLFLYVHAERTITLGLIILKNRYRELMRVSRIWRNLKYRKWHGFAHGKDTIPGPGTLALFCVACPQPGINLPQGWEDDTDQ